MLYSTASAKATSAAASFEEVSSSHRFVAFCFSFQARCWFHRPLQTPLRGAPTGRGLQLEDLLRRSTCHQVPLQNRTCVEPFRGTDMDHLVCLSFALLAKDGDPCVRDVVDLFASPQLRRSGVWMAALFVIFLQSNPCP